MRVSINLGSLKETRWYEYALRFFFGGLITAVTGVIAKKFGPGVGGLFLAFPAIFPAAASLIEKHEKEKKEELGLHGTIRGRKAAGLDAAGAAMGAIGLVVFAVLIWKFMERYPPWVVIGGSTIVWFLISATIWEAESRLG